MISREELALLERGIDRLDDWGSELLIPFSARQLRLASVVWINQRWFLERSLDVTDEAVRERVQAWLLAEFAFAIPRGEDPLDSYTDIGKTFFADRYGSSGIAPHGGSGRAAVSGCFQVKGIGATPLVGQGAGWGHSHGCAWLEEAIREAIYSEVVAAEFPLGGVPIIAIIDTGLRCQDPSGGVAQRRAILVRPAVLRPAHLERATGFRPKAAAARTHLEDVARVKDFVRCVVERIATKDPQGLQGWLNSLFSQVAEQAAFGQVHRLFLGSYFSSNLSLVAELLDFGGFRAVPDWSRAFAENHIPGFGDEIDVISSAIRSVVFFCNKYHASQEGRISEKEILTLAKQRLKDTFERECLRVWHLDPSTPAPLRHVVIQSMSGYFSEQQRTQVSYQYEPPSDRRWIYEQLRGVEGNRAASSCELATISRIHTVLREHFHALDKPNAISLSLLTALRLLNPRSALYREKLQALIFEQVGGISCEEAPSLRVVEQAIASCLSSGRRHWPSLPAGLVVLGQVCGECSSALLCDNPQTRRSYIWVEAARLEHNVRIFDQWISASAIEQFESGSDAKRWRGLFPVDNGMPQGQRLELSPVSPMALTFPSMSFYYDYPHWLLS